MLLAVATRPPSDGDRLLHRLAATAGAEVSAPAPLSAAASAEIVRSLAPDADDEVCKICHARARGNPFYLRELANGLRSEHLERGPAAADRLADWSPESVTRYVRARVAALPARARSLARAVAILGQDAHAGHAAAIARLDSATADAAADALRGAGILSAGPGLAFEHPIVRSAVYEEIPAAARAAAHAQAARLFAAEGASDERIAAQLMAREPRSDQWTSERLTQAGRDALGRGAAVAAAGYLRRALEEPPPPTARASLLLELGAAEASAYEAAPAVDHLRQAFEAATEPAWAPARGAAAGQSADPGRAGGRGRRAGPAGARGVRRRSGARRVGRGPARESGPLPGLDAAARARRRGAPARACGRRRGRRGDARHGGGRDGHGRRVCDPRREPGQARPRAPARSGGVDGRLLVHDRAPRPDRGGGAGARDARARRGDRRSLPSRGGHRPRFPDGVPLGRRLPPRQRLRRRGGRARRLRPRARERVVDRAAGERRLSRHRTGRAR